MTPHERGQPLAASNAPAALWQAYQGVGGDAAGGAHYTASCTAEEVQYLAGATGDLSAQKSATYNLITRWLQATTSCHHAASWSARLETLCQALQLKLRPDASSDQNLRSN